MKKERLIWTVAEIHGADEWEYAYPSKKEAIAEAARAWKHFTAQEKSTQAVEVRGYRPADLVAGDFAVWAMPWRNGKHTLSLIADRRRQKPPEKRKRS